MSKTPYNTDIVFITYIDDQSYRQCLRDLFFMNSHIEEDLDEITQDEQNYDIDAANKAMDYVYNQTKDNIHFQNLYDCAAAKMFSTDREIGLAVLFSYDNLKFFHSCFIDYLDDPLLFDENTKSYIEVYNNIK